MAILRPHTGNRAVKKRSRHAYVATFSALAGIFLFWCGYHLIGAWGTNDRILAAILALNAVVCVGFIAMIEK